MVLTGSVPPGTPATAYADCVAAAHDRGFTTIVDCSGPHLIAAIEAGAHVVKPNRHELLATVGAEGMEGVRRLREQAPQTTVVASDGPAGLLYDGPAGRWRAVPSRPLIGNPTGAGDALYQFVRVSRANTGITSAQSIPTYSNVDGGLGIVTSRYTTVRQGIVLADEALDSLRTGIYTRNLNFN